MGTGGLVSYYASSGRKLNGNLGFADNSDDKNKVRIDEANSLIKDSLINNLYFSEKEDKQGYEAVCKFNNNFKVVINTDRLGNMTDYSLYKIKPRFLRKALETKQKMYYKGASTKKYKNKDYVAGMSLTNINTSNIDFFREIMFLDSDGHLKSRTNIQNIKKFDAKLSKKKKYFSLAEFAKETQRRLSEVRGLNIEEAQSYRELSEIITTKYAKEIKEYGIEMEGMNLDKLQKLLDKKRAKSQKISANEVQAQVDNKTKNKEEQSASSTPITKQTVKSTLTSTDYANLKTRLR